MKRFMLAAVLAVMGAGAPAQEVSLAEAGLQARIDALAVDAGAHGFELGMLSALRAVEKSLQTRYEYGLGDRLTRMPVLRLQTGTSNPAPKAADPDILAQVMQTLLADLDAARDHLTAAEQGEIEAFTLTLQDVWFDVNSNGVREPGEEVMETLAPILLGRWALNEIRESGAMDAPIEVRFDEADHAWLRAYTHMLSGVGNLFLAFDPTPVIAGLAAQREALAQAPEIENTFDQVALQAELEVLEAEQERLDALMKEVQARQQELYAERNALRQAEPRDEAAYQAKDAEYRLFSTSEMRPLREQTRAIRAEIRAVRAKLSADGERQQNFRIDEMRGSVDAIYVILAALRQQPDAARVQAARDHWLEMIAHNKVFWAALQKESDDDREWIPNPQQTSAIGITVDEDLARAWQLVLADAEDVLEGRLLITHPLLPAGTGINLKAYADNPAPLDLVDWIHGIGAYPYAAKGPRVTVQRWAAFQRLTRGNAGGFALFFN